MPKFARSQMEAIGDVLRRYYPNHDDPKDAVYCIRPLDVYPARDNADSGRRRALNNLVKAGLAWSRCPRTRTLIDFSDPVDGSDPFNKPDRVYVPRETYDVYHEQLRRSKAGA